jgi:hypothetical protein
MTDIPEMPDHIAAIDTRDSYGQIGVWPRVGTWMEWWEGAPVKSTDYIRADLYDAQEADIERLRAELTAAYERIDVLDARVLECVGEWADCDRELTAAREQLALAHEALKVGSRIMW